MHLFLHPGIEIVQTYTESVPQRTISAVLAARDDLMAGFTAERDMGTEGAGSAGTAVRNEDSFIPYNMPVYPGALRIADHPENWLNNSGQERVAANLD